jgi:glycosyltransferase involved in cell wall biosynthesis
VTVIGRVPHSQVLRYQLEADVLLVFQTGFPLQVPRKLFEYMSMQKPVLAVAERDSATARIVEDSGVGVIAEQDDRSVREAVQNLYRTWLESPGTGSDQPRVLEYRNERLAQRLREVLSSAAAATGVRDA